MNNQISCPISGKEMKLSFSETLLGKYKVDYFFCEESGLLKTENPYWLNEAYEDAIADTDIGVVSRNISNSQILSVILYCLGIEQGKFVDVAGGYGLLTRLMRDKGFDCYTTDKYCTNLFAKTFEPTNDFKADALFAFEVLEHIENPLEFISALFEQYGCKTLIFSTETFNNKIPSKNWWYYSFETGQHITFYQPKTLSLLADKLECQYQMINSGLHIITDIQIPKISRFILSNRRICKLYSLYLQRQRTKLSKLQSDYKKIRENLQKISK